MLLTMSTAAFADIATGLVSEEKPGWPNEFGFGGQIKVMREEEVLSYDLEENNKIDLQPGDDLYIPLYYTSAECESVTIGASKEEMTGHVPYTGSIDKNWKINFIDKSKTIIESTDFYRAESKDSGLVKGALYIKVQTADSYNSLTDLEFNFGVYVSERYSQNKTEQIQIEASSPIPKRTTWSTLTGRTTSMRRLSGKWRRTRTALQPSTSTTTPTSTSACSAATR